MPTHFPDCQPSNAALSKLSFLPTSMPKFTKAVADIISSLLLNSEIPDHSQHPSPPQQHPQMSVVCIRAPSTSFQDVHNGGLVLVRFFHKEGKETTRQFHTAKEVSLGFIILQCITCMRIQKYGIQMHSVNHITYMH